MSQKTLERLDITLRRINAHPEYSLYVRKETLGAIRRDAIRHSIAIEDESEATGCQSSYSKRDRQFGTNIERAWDHLARSGITTASLASLGHLIEPANNPTANYRNIEVTIGTVPPSAPERIIYEMDSLAYTLQRADIHPVLRSIEAHARLAHIHPYTDGNGRAARLLQNFTLEQAAYPPAIIPVNERELYASLLRKALEARVNLGSRIDAPHQCEAIFHQYLTSKVLNSAQALEEALQQRRMYTVTVESQKGVDVGMLQAMAKRVRGHGRRTDSSGVSVKVNGKNGHHKRQRTLEVTGDIGIDELNGILERCQVDYPITFSTEITDHIVRKKP
ncbi:hypothetical protein COV20_01010 [Candidatus Woesearchaeota archaeon CG10_big_fil_rev_8_21_14_0_10_45_16]|nr:MAG: hypothetical protein COV20_01010 [Candidatus Woesearchaeota archaeon CG10_big_fil_rev_8_21_14_0_10_45_16]